jgi:TRAP transporter TAXI family solute receptor
MARIDINHISWRDALVIGVPLALLVALAFWLTSRFVQPAPPDRLVLSTGAEGGDYARYGERYRDYFAAYGVTVVLRPSNGSVENLQRLNEETADAAFVQGGTVPPLPDGATSPVVSLGALYPEIVWVFVRQRERVTTLSELKGKRIAVGPFGSGLRLLAVAMLRDSGVGDGDATLSEQGGPDAAAALLESQIDAAFLIAGPTSPIVVRLLAHPEVRPMNFAQGEALSRRFAALSSYKVPRGVSDLAADLPHDDVSTVAVTANLLVRDALHPALMYLLLDAASAIHGAHTIVADAGQFPSMRNQDVPLASEADRFYKSGKPFLKRYLPYWLANLVDRLLVLLIPVIAVLLPVIRFLPDIYEFRLNAKIGHWYGRIGTIEDEIGDAPAPERIPGYLKRLDDIEAQVNAMNFPSSAGNRVYGVRAAIDLVRERLGRPVAKTLPGLRPGERGGSAA